MATDFHFDAPDRVDVISPSIERSWYASGRIVAYKMLDISVAIAQEWAELVVQTIHEWNPHQPYLALHDVAYRGVAMKYAGLGLNMVNPAITNEGRARLAPVLECESGVGGRIALLMSLHFSGYVTRVLAAKEMQKRHAGNMQYRVYTEQTAALAWLAAALPE